MNRRSLRIAFSSRTSIVDEFGFAGASFVDHRAFSTVFAYKWANHKSLRVGRIFDVMIGDAQAFERASADKSSAFSTYKATDIAAAGLKLDPASRKVLLIDARDIIGCHNDVRNEKVGRLVWALMTNLGPAKGPNHVPARSIVRVVQQKAIGASDEPIVPVVSNSFMSADNLRPRHDTVRRKTRSRFPLRQRDHCRVAREKSLHVHIRCIVDIRRPATTSGFRRAWRHLSDQTAPRRREEAANRQVCACTAWGRRRDPFRGARLERAKFPCRQRNRSCKQDRSKSSASNTVPSAAHRQIHPESRPR